MSHRENEEHLAYDEETLREKATRRAGLAALIGTGALSTLHIFSHIIPAVGVLGLSFGEKYKPFYDIISSDYMQFAYLPFVVLSFYYIYRDHKHHKHEHELRKRLKQTEEELRYLKEKYRK